MTDVFDKEKRSLIMSHVTGADTEPEIKVRKLIYGMGFRYQVHVRNLPGCPDIVFSGRKKVIFVHGCFWHGHEGCNRSKRPTTNTEFWNKKIDKNIARDADVKKELVESGWQVLIIWECQTRKTDELIQILQDFLGERGK